MGPSTIENLLRLAAVAGVPGVIVSSIADSTGGALTFGLLTVGSATALILVTAAARGPVPFDTPTGTSAFDEARAEAVERRVAELVAAGADEAAVRALVHDAVGLGRSAPSGRG